MSKVFIACYECGEPTLVPTMEKNQTKQICLSCKEKRILAWERKIEDRIEASYEKLV